MGRAKALLPFRNGTFLSVLADTLGKFAEPVVAVFGFDGENVAKQAPAGVLTTINQRYQEGMLTSLQAGLKIAQADRYLFTLVDHPAVKPETVAALVQSSARIAIPRAGGKRGHPVMFDAGIAREFLAQPVTAKVRDAIDRNAAEIEYIDVPDTAIHDDIDNPALYAALLAREGAGA